MANLLQLLRKGTPARARPDSLRRMTVDVPDEPPSTDALFLVLRRMRAPLVTVVAVFAVMTFGLSLMPGTSENPQPLSLFESFYVVSYTGVTIGFGELPHAFSTQQRMWVILTIYSSVLAWTYSIAALLALTQDRTFRQAIALQRFTRKMRGVRSPFVLVVGYGRAGEAVCRALEEQGRAFVVLDQDQERVQQLALDGYVNDHPGLTGTGRDVYLIPSALGASQVGPHTRVDNCVYPAQIGWNLGPANLAGTDTDTLFGSAAYRALVSAGEAVNPVPGEGSEGGPVSAVYWYQGESDNSSTSLRGAYSGRTEDVFDAFRSRLAAVTAAVDPVIIYAQLAPYGCCEGAETEVQAEAEDLRSHDIAERQRRFEAAAYRVAAALDPSTGTSAGVDQAHMVVTHDLPRFDRIHLSAEAQTVLAGRVALAYQEHVLGWEVDGTGPRITNISRSGNSVVLTLDRDVAQTTSPGADGYSGYFTVYWGAPSGTNYDGYGGNVLEVTDVRRDPSDPRRVVIQHEPPPGSGSIYLRYKRPYEPTDSSDYIEDVIRGEASGLPLPSFGPLRAN